MAGMWKLSICGSTFTQLIYVKMRYLEDHNQDRVKNISEESALRNWTAFIYSHKGAMLIYAGQENQNETKSDLFNKDVIILDGGHDISNMLS